MAAADDELERIEDALSETSMSEHSDQEAMAAESPHDPAAGVEVVGQTSAAAGIPAGAMLPVKFTDTDNFFFVYKTLLETSGDAACVAYAQDRLRRGVLCVPSSTLLRDGECWATFMYQSGYFAAAIFQVCPTAEQKEALRTASKAERAREAPWPRALLHKRHQRYTTRRKQGGSQAAHDAKGGAANSVGAQLRRAGEVHLQEDVMGLLADPEWSAKVKQCRRIFIACPKTWRSKLYDGHTLVKGDERIAFVPLNVGRPSLAENTRICITLSTPLPCDPALLPEPAAVYDAGLTPEIATSPPVVVMPKPRATAAVGSAAGLGSSGSPRAALEESSSDIEEASNLLATAADGDGSAELRKKKKKRRAKARNKAAEEPVADPKLPSGGKPAPRPVDEDEDDAALDEAIAVAKAEAAQLERMKEERELVRLRADELMHLVDAIASRLRMPAAVVKSALLPADLFNTSPLSSFEDRARSIVDTCRTINGMMDAGASAADALVAADQPELAAAAVASGLGTMVDWSAIHITAATHTGQQRGAPQGTRAQAVRLR